MYINLNLKLKDLLWLFCRLYL